MAKRTLTDRVTALEVEVARVKCKLESADRADPWSRDVDGAFANDPVFLEAMQLGRAYRKSTRPMPRERRKSAAERKEKVR
jgi:hypothetical protein